MTARESLEARLQQLEGELVEAYQLFWDGDGRDRVLRLDHEAMEVMERLQKLEHE